MSKGLELESLVVGLEDLNTFKIIQKDFHRTLPENRVERYNSVRGDYWGKVMEKKEEGDRARGVLFYMEERYEEVHEKNYQL